MRPRRLPENRLSSGLYGWAAWNALASPPLLSVPTRADILSRVTKEAVFAKAVVLFAGLDSGPLNEVKAAALVAVSTLTAVIVVMTV